MESFVKTAAHYLSNIVELVATFIIFIALVEFIAAFYRTLTRKQKTGNDRWLRLNFGSRLTIVLELLLAADILETAIAPTWDEIGKLAAIAAIRTALNYFLERELKDMSTGKEPAADSSTTTV